jgi:hypothetical protein
MGRLWRLKRQIRHFAQNRFSKLDGRRHGFCITEIPYRYRHALVWTLESITLLF